jgi:hypothetical protein
MYRDVPRELAASNAWVESTASSFHGMLDFSRTTGVVRIVERDLPAPQRQGTALRLAQSSHSAHVPPGHAQQVLGCPRAQPGLAFASCGSPD